MYGANQCETAPGYNSYPTFTVRSHEATDERLFFTDVPTQSQRESLMLRWLTLLDMTGSCLNTTLWWTWLHFSLIASDDRGPATLYKVTAVHFLFPHWLFIRHACRTNQKGASVKSLKLLPFISDTFPSHAVSDVHHRLQEPNLEQVFHSSD